MIPTIETLLRRQIEDLQRSNIRRLEQINRLTTDNVDMLIQIEHMTRELDKLREETDDALDSI